MPSGVKKYRKSTKPGSRQTVEKFQSFFFFFFRQASLKLCESFTMAFAQNKLVTEELWLHL